MVGPLILNVFGRCNLAENAITLYSIGEIEERSYSRIFWVDILNELGSTRRFPLSPLERIKAAAPYATPMLIVCTLAVQYYYSRNEKDS